MTNSSMNDVFMLTSVLIMITILLLFIFKAIGSITIHSPNSIYISPNLKNILYSIFISIILLIPIIKKYGKKSIFIIFVLSIFIYIILKTTNNSGYNLLPKTDFPPPTHLGLDGVSLQTQVAGNYI